MMKKNIMALFAVMKLSFQSSTIKIKHYGLAVYHIFDCFKIFKIFSVLAKHFLNVFIRVLFFFRLLSHFHLKKHDFIIIIVYYFTLFNSQETNIKSPRGLFTLNNVVY